MSQGSGDKVQAQTQPGDGFRVCTGQDGRDPAFRPGLSLWSRLGIGAEGWCPRVSEPPGPASLPLSEGDLRTGRP